MSASKRRFCPYCGRHVRVMYVHHFVMTLFTCGLWLPVLLYDLTRSESI